MAHAIGNLTLLTPYQVQVIDYWCWQLEYGGYEQTTGRLHDRVGFCCLGVLCDLGDGEWEAVIIGGKIYARNGQATVLPRNIQEAAGLTDHECASLMQMNDNGDGFPQIAKWIRENILANRDPARLGF